MVFSALGVDQEYLTSFAPAAFAHTTPRSDCIEERQGMRYIMAVIGSQSGVGWKRWGMYLNWGKLDKPLLKAFGHRFNQSGIVMVHPKQEALSLFFRVEPLCYYCAYQAAALIIHN